MKSECQNEKKCNKRKGKSCLQSSTPSSSADATAAVVVAAAAAPVESSTAG